MILCFFTISKSFEESVTSNFSKGPELIISSDEGIISDAITLFKLNSFLSSKTSSEPICPDAPITKILSCKRFYRTEKIY